MAVVQAGEETVIISLIGFLAGSEAPGIDENPFLGFCRSKTEYVEMSEVYFLENKSVKTSANGRNFTLRIADRKIYVEEVGGDETEIYLINELIPGGEAIDVVDKFAYYKGNLYLYWKETYLYRMYNHGLLSYDGKDFTSWCVGRGGATRSH